MSQAIVVREYGPPEVLKLESIEVGKPKSGELRIRQTCLGVNFHDIYVRSGLYKTLSLPGIPGIEGVGVVEEVASDTAGFVPGDRVAYITGAYGCYASERLLPASIAVKLPDTVADTTVASVLLKGLTVDMLVRRVHRVQRGDWILVQAAAGAVGQLLSQWASHLGATVIGTAGSPEKAEIAKRAGCAHVILYREEDVAERVKAITGGRGVDVAYDSVGKDTFAGSLNSLAMCSHLINFGQSSGPVDPVALSQLSTRSSTLSRPMAFHYVAQRSALEDSATSLFTALSEGWLRPEPPTEFALKDAAAAHRLLESRKALGPVILRI